MQPAYLIEFPNDRAYEKALEAFRTVPETRCIFPERRMLVTARHVEALDEGNVPYSKLSGLPGGKTPVHSATDSSS